MTFTSAGRAYSVATKNKSGTLVVAPVVGISRYPRCGVRTGFNYILKMRIRTVSVKVSVGYDPQIGDIVAVMWTPHSRYNPSDIQYFIINEKNNNVPITEAEVIAHFTGGGDVSDSGKADVTKT